MRTKERDKEREIFKKKKNEREMKIKLTELVRWSYFKRSAGFIVWPKAVYCEEEEGPPRVEDCGDVTAPAARLCKEGTGGPRPYWSLLKGEETPPIKKNLQ